MMLIDVIIVPGKNIISISFLDYQFDFHLFLIILSLVYFS